jgi:hypothetical protein
MVDRAGGPNHHYEAKSLVKLQYLGDSRDAFKWDLLHWLCTRAEPPFARLLFIPLLTPDDAVPRDERTPHAWFPCRPLIRPFVAGLATLPRSLERIAALGAIEQGHPLEVTVAQAHAFVDRDARRASYWDWGHPERYADTLVFLDPDNGFEARTQRGPKWVRHAEVKWLLERLPGSSAVAVYQHRPRMRRWDDLFTDLAARLDYAPNVLAVHEANLASLVRSRARGTAERLARAAIGYSEGRLGVRAAALSCGARGDQRTGGPARRRPAARFAIRLERERVGTAGFEPATP